MRLNKNNYSFTLNLYNKKGKLVSHTQTHRIMQISDRIRRANFKTTHSRAFLRVNYGKGEANEGIYTTKTELMKAWRAFYE